MPLLRRHLCGILAALASGACASPTEPSAGIVTAQVAQASVVPGARFVLTANRQETLTYYVNRCAWCLQRREAGGWVRSRLPAAPCEGSWVGVSVVGPVQLELEMPVFARAGEYRIELVVSPFDLNAGPVISVARLEEATVVSNSFRILAHP